MLKLYFVVVVLIGTAATANAERVRLPQLGWELAITGNDPWKVERKAMGSLTVDRLWLEHQGVYFGVRIFRDSSACSTILLATAEEIARDNAHAKPRPDWLPGTWHPAMLVRHDAFGEARLVCRDLAGGGALSVLVDSLGPLAQPARADQRLAPVFAALEATVRSQGLARTQPVTGDAVGPLAAAIERVRAAPQVLPQLGAAVTVPKGWKLEQSTTLVLRSHAQIKSTVWPRVVATDIPCADGLAPYLDDMRRVPRPAGLPSTLAPTALQSDHPNMTAYLVCADIPGGVALIVVDVRFTTDRTPGPEAIAIVAELVTKLRDRSYRIPAQPPVAMKSLGISVPHAIDGAVWTTHGSENTLFAEWPQDLNGGALFVKHSTRCRSGTRHPFLPTTWTTAKRYGLENIGTKQPIVGRERIEACVDLPAGGSLGVTLDVDTATFAKRTPLVRRMLEEVGVAMGVPRAPAASHAAPQSSRALTSASDAAAPDAHRNDLTPYAPRRDPTPYAPHRDSTPYAPDPEPRSGGGTSLTLAASAITPEATGVDSGYAIAGGLVARGHVGARFVARIAGELGYASSVGLTLDGSVGMGLHTRRFTAHAVLGTDALGLGEEPEPGRLRIPMQPYYGADARAELGKVDVGAAYYVRSDDEIDSEYRIEAGYRYRWNRRLALRYTGYAKSARVISLRLAF